MSTFGSKLVALARLLKGRRVVALTGAGISTESGIPDYRGEGTRRRASNPIQYRAFVSDEQARKRYWSRSLLGWPRMASAVPNAAHRTLARLEEAGMLRGIITQNVDRLHQEAGCQEVIELHGALAEVCCLDCGEVTDRWTLQERLRALNPDWDSQEGALLPDGDIALPDSASHHFRVPCCQRCGGTLKPNVVFFGENVPSVRVEAAWNLFDQAEVLLVLGSSLTVYSGYRFVLRASQIGLPVAIINLGQTRGDDAAILRLEERLGTALPRLAGLIGA